MKQPQDLSTTSNANNIIRKVNNTRPKEKSCAYHNNSSGINVELNLNEYLNIEYLWEKTKEKCYVHNIFLIKLK